MAHLTESAQASRIIIKYGLIALVALMVGRAVIGWAVTLYKKSHPTIPPATIGFGVLPLVAFPQQEKKPLTYTLETATGKLPIMPTQAEVLLETAARQNLLALERATKEAETLGFSGVAEKISDTEYRWRVASPVAAALTASIYDGRFVWETNWPANPNFLAEKNLPSKAQAIEEARSLLSRIDPKVKDISPEYAEVSYLKGLAGEFKPVESLLDADFVQVDLFRTPYDEQYPFVTSSPTQGPFRLILSGNPSLGKVVRLDYNYFPIDYTTRETYPLRPVAQAWQELKEGKGYIASIDDGVSEVTVRKVDLAYYDSLEPQPYVQPVYRFTGDNNFVGYIQAVKDPKPQD